MASSPPALAPISGLRRFWQHSRGFWKAPDGRLAAWGLSLGILIGIGVQLVVQYELNLWNRAFFDALEQKNVDAVWRQVQLLAPLAVGAVAISAILVVARMALHRNWRYWITVHLFRRWLVNGRYHQLNLIEGDHRNPEQRIAEDVRIAVEAPVDLAVGLIAAVSTALMFLGVLWGIGVSITLWGTRIPGALLLGAVLWASITTTTMVLVARRMVQVIDKKNQAEADFRYELTRVREHGESIALLGGEIEERATLTRRLSDAIAAFRHFGREIAKTNIVSAANMVLAPTIPALICAPQYLAGGLTLGEVMQAITAFVAVQGAMNWVVDNYPRIADMHASSHRVATLLRSIDALAVAEAPDNAARIHIIEADGAAALALDKVHVTLDDGTAVIGETEVAIAPGEWVLLVGESGTGKSTLVRAIAGLWPWGAGEIRVRRGAKLFFMPQRAYVPTGSLKRAVSYPEPAETVPDDLAAKALEAANLGPLVERLHEVAPWDRTLSGGEQQRLAFARLFIQQPDIIVMDEATSALDIDMQAMMLDQVKRLLPNAAVVSVGHRPELESFHERRVEFARRADGARVVSDAPISTQRSPIERVSTWLRGHRATAAS